MQITEKKSNGEKPAYEVSFVELRLEEIVARLNRFKRADEKPFEATNVVAEYNQRTYELFGRPLVQSFANEYGAKLSRLFHPLRLQRWAFSDLNPSLWWLAPAAQAVKAQRQALGPDDPARRVESTVAEITSACLDFGRALRDTAAEATFFQVYGNIFAAYLGEEHAAGTEAQPTDPRELPFVKEALASVDKGGYAEALARVAFLMAHKDEPLPLSRLHLAQELLDDYRDLLPDLPLDEGNNRRRNHRALRTGKAVETRQSARQSGSDRLLHCSSAPADSAAHRAFDRAGRDARAHSSRAWLDGSPGGSGPGAAPYRARSRNTGGMIHD
jgi:hypothetical protein